MAVVGTIVFASFQRSAQSQSTSRRSRLVEASPPNASPPASTAGISGCPLKGKRGSFTVELRTTSSSGTLPLNRTRSWWLRPKGGTGPEGADATNQYARISGGGGRLVSGGHQAGWYAAPLRVGFPVLGGAKQRVLITLKGRPNGVFVLRPLEPGIALGQGDSGTQHSYGTG